MIERPVFNYPSWPHQPREGIQAEGNGKFLTRSLFLETALEEDYDKVRYCLAEHEVYVPKLGRWIPSAWMIYIHATDEYDALRKLVGNVRHWETLKRWVPNGRRAFADTLADWQMEQAYIQKAAIKETLYRGALGGGPGYTSAAKMLIQMIDGTTVGRPKKEKEKMKAPVQEVDADHARILKLVT